MKKKMRLVLEVEVADLPAETRKECAEMVGDDASALPRLKDYSAQEISEVFDGLSPEVTSELFGGTDIYAQIADSKVIEAAWIA
jgi:hypothetical protein